MKKEKYIVEYSLNNVSPSVLWTYIGTVNGLADWFADDVVADGKLYTFYWNKTPQQAMQTTFRVGNFIRFHWLDDEDTKTYFEFRINVAELTGNVVLEITDFAEEGEKQDSIELWNNQVNTLKRVLGA
ncbi:START-like domain-containing protein [Coprobacter tertius]|uniref:START-like domain-containing protein n=1 Tax=Coprobacter tertius TaxID=2944915 RepID=A0ABT1MFS0_9BACT|nr:START-like domain-containing protein [Coprobacter tertius]MCP9611485.1 START-like domain-containing protein [Coprobacter tertius]